MEKYEFSTQDYLMYKHYFEEQLDKIQINSESKSVNQQYDKTFKEILSNQKEMKSFIKQFIGLEVENDEIERYNSNFITQNYERRESDIIYKIKEKEKSEMEEWLERVKKNDERIRRNLIKKGKDEGKIEGKIEGIKEAIVGVIKNMLQHNQDEELIIKVTNAKREDIEKIKKELKIQVN